MTLEVNQSSYPHPWLMPDYWQFPTVSMGLGPLQAIYQNVAGIWLFPSVIQMSKISAGAEY